MKKIIIIFLGILLLFVVFFFSFTEQHFPFDPYIDTVFSKDFTWEKFGKVAVGMKEDEVINMLGAHC